jgi:hypothetical protein
MKSLKHGAKRSKLGKRLALDDMRYLQKKITGRSVYKNLGALYLRKPKHRNVWYPH